MVSKKILLALAIYLNYVWMSQLVTIRTSQLSFWSRNRLVIKICVCRMVWGLVGYGCRLAVLDHGFGIGHFGLQQPKLTKSRVTKKWSFSGHGPTPENSNIFFRVCINVG